MTSCPLAAWDPLGPQTALRMDSHDIVCLHTMAGTYNGTNAMFHQNGYKGTESHFGIAGDGRAKQWQDLDYRADANYEGNSRVISIETADMGEDFPIWSGSNVPAWTPGQLDKIVAIVRWCCDRYNIPKQLIPDTQRGRRGIGYHRQGIDGNFGQPFPGRRGAGERWSTGTGKPCPGDRRIRQLIEIVIPRVRGDKEDDDMAMTPKEREALVADIAKATTARIDAAYQKSGSVIRQESRVLARLGVEDAVDPEQPLGEWLASVDARLAALEAKHDAPPADPPAPA